MSDTDNTNEKETTTEAAPLLEVEEQDDGKILVGEPGWGKRLLKLVEKLEKRIEKLEGKSVKK